MNSKCLVCVDPETSDNRIIVCGKCNASVHMLCYGIDPDTFDLSDPWKCSPCSSGALEPFCELCMKKGGAFKVTTSQKWVHVVCALFVECVNFEDHNSMEPVDISKIPAKYWKKTCVFCIENCGYCCMCSQPRCFAWIHVTCAQNANCLEEIINERTNMITFRAYCAEHKPSKASRRLSSNFVPGKLVEKRQERQSLTPTDENDEINSTDFDLSNTRDVVNATESDADDDSSVSNVADLNASKVSSATESETTSTSVEIDVIVNKTDNADDNSNADEFNGSKASKNDEDDKEEQQQTTIQGDGGDANSFWWDGQDIPSLDRERLEAELLLKDVQIAKLKAKKKKFKEKIEHFQEENENLQLQIQLLNAQLEKQMVISNDSSRSNVVKVLKKRTKSQLSDDGTDLVYSNGVRVSAKAAKQLETISGDPAFDRAYINSHFFVVFSEKYFRKQVKRGLSREETLSKIRNSSRYDTMKDMYELRVLRDGTGDVKTRLGLFKATFRMKFNNWWTTKVPKMLKN